MLHFNKPGSLFQSAILQVRHQLRVSRLRLGIACNEAFKQSVHGGTESSVV